MRLIPLNQDGCGTQACPALFASDRGTLVLQGTLLPADVEGATPAPHEALVEVPRDFLINALRDLLAE